MADAPPPEARLSLAPGYRFQWEEAQGAHVLLYPEGMIRLSESAAAIIVRGDGSRRAAEIVADLEAAYPGADLAEDVRQLLAAAWSRGWIAAAGDG
jgi:pyrroloquinoline quinone biosynthesis protein D